MCAIWIKSNFSILMIYHIHSFGITRLMDVFSVKLGVLGIALAHPQGIKSDIGNSVGCCYKIDILAIV